MPEAIRPADPELRHNMLGHDRDRQRVPHERATRPTSPSTGAARSGGRCPGSTPRVVDPETLDDVAGRRASASCGSAGPSLMEGYYGRERSEVFTPDGWYRTGDLFHVDADGFFYFHGRRGDMIKTAGANVSPREVEAALRDVTGGLATHRARASPTPSAARSSAAVILAEPDDRARPRRAARRPARAAVGVQGAAALPRARAGRAADALERQARPAPRSRSCFDER